MLEQQKPSNLTENIFPSMIVKNVYEAIKMNRKAVTRMMKVARYYSDEETFATLSQTLTLLPVIANVFTGKVEIDGNDTFTLHPSNTFSPCQIASTHVAVYPSLNGTGIP